MSSYAAVRVRLSSVGSGRCLLSRMASCVCLCNSSFRTNGILVSIPSLLLNMLWAQQENRKGRERSNLCAGPQVSLYAHTECCMFGCWCCGDKSAHSCLSGPSAAFSARQICRCLPVFAGPPRHRPQATFYSCGPAVAVIKVVGTRAPSYEAETYNYSEPAVELLVLRERTDHGPGGFLIEGDTHSLVRTAVVSLCGA